MQIYRKNTPGEKRGGPCLRMPIPSVDPRMRQFPKPRPAQMRRRAMRINRSRTLKLVTILGTRTLPSRHCRPRAPSTGPNSILPLRAKGQYWTPFHTWRSRVRDMARSTRIKANVIKGSSRPRVLGLGRQWVGFRQTHACDRADRETLESTLISASVLDRSRPLIYP